MTAGTTSSKGKTTTTMKKQEISQLVQEAVDKALSEKFAQVLADISWRIGQAYEVTGRVLGDGIGKVFAEDLDLGPDRVLMTGYTITNNSPSAGSIAWADLHMVYGGTDYTITNGNTANKYAWWSPTTTPTALQTSNTKPSLAQGEVLVFVNNTGTARVMLSDTNSSLPNVIADGTVDSGSILANAVTTNAIAPLAVTSAELAANAVVSGKIANGAVSASAQIANGIVATAQLASNAVDSTKLADGAVSTSAKIASGVVGTTQLAASAVDGTKLADNAVSGNKIAANGVTSGKLADGAVNTSAKIASGIVGTTQIASNAVDSTKLADGAVSTSAKIADGVVGSTKIVDGAVTTGKIASGAVGAAKLDILRHVLY